MGGDSGDIPLIRESGSWRRDPGVGGDSGDCLTREFESWRQNPGVGGDSGDIRRVSSDGLRLGCSELLSEMPTYSSRVIAEGKVVLSVARLLLGLISGPRAGRQAAITPTPACMVDQTAGGVPLPILLVSSGSSCAYQNLLTVVVLGCREVAFETQLAMALYEARGTAVLLVKALHTNPSRTMAAAVEL